MTFSVLTFIGKVMKLITVSAAGLSNSRIADNKLICDQIRQFSIKVTKRNFESWKKKLKLYRGKKYHKSFDTN